MYFLFLLHCAHCHTLHFFLLFATKYNLQNCEEIKENGEEAQITLTHLLHSVICFQYYYFDSFGYSYQ